MTYETDDEEDLLFPGPRARQKLLAMNVRDNPAISMPSGAVETPPPATGAGYADEGDDDSYQVAAAGPQRMPQPAPRAAPPQQSFQREMTPTEVGLALAGSMSAPTPEPAAPGTALPKTRAQLRDMLFNKVMARPDEGSLIADQKRRESGAHNDFIAGLALSALGGESFSPIGGHVLQQALKNKQPYEIPGGWGTVTSEGVAWNPMKQREADLQHLQFIMKQDDDEEARRLAREDKRIAGERHDETVRAIAAGRHHGSSSNEPLMQVFDKDSNSVIWVPRSQAAGKMTGANIKNGFAGQKMPSEIARMSIGISALEKTLDEFDRALQKFGPRTLQQLNASERADMNSIAKRAHLESKEMFTLGALTGPDVGMLEGVLANPASWTGVLYGKDGLNAQLASMRNAVKYRKQAIAEQYGSGQQGAAKPGSNPPNVSVTEIPKGQ